MTGEKGHNEENEEGNTEEQSQAVNNKEEKTDAKRHNVKEKRNINMRSEKSSSERLKKRDGDKDHKAYEQGVSKNNVWLCKAEALIKTKNYWARSAQRPKTVALFTATVYRLAEGDPSDVFEDNESQGGEG